jgi:phosphate butyryltransferase
MAIKTFKELTDYLHQLRPHKRVGVVAPSDEATQKALQWAEQENIIRPFVFDDSDPSIASQKAVAAARRGEIDILMKGFVNTDVLLKAILNKETGILKPGKVLTHIAVAELKNYHKLLFFTDSAVIPCPTQEQREVQVGYIAEFCRHFEIEQPKISLIHCSEKVDERHFPYTAGYETIKAKAAAGAFGSCIVDGPLDLKTSCSAYSLAVKHIPSPIAGDADALVFPDIEAGNLFYKTITLFSEARTAGVLQGTDVPVVLPSRADEPENKYLSLCTACLL